MPTSQRSTALTVTLVVVALALAATAIGLLATRRGPGQGNGTGSTGTSSTPTSGTGSTQSTPPPTTDIKPAIVGLIDRAGMPPPAFQSVVRAFVVQTSWASLQPTEGGPIAPDNAIDKAIAEVRSLEAQDPSVQMEIKLRVYAGVGAPQWAQEIGGAPITIKSSQPSTATFNGTIGRYWTSAYGDAYDQFENELAAKYDNVPEIREEVMSRCTIEFAESFTRGASDPSISSALLAAGYTVSADEACIQSEITEAAVWRHTRSDLALNPYQEVMDPHPKFDDVSFTIQMMQFCRSTLGERCVLESNSIRSPPQSSYVPVYNEMQSLGGPIAFQTATASKVGDLGATIQYAASLGASSVELPSAYTSMSPTAVQGFASDLGASAT